MGRIANNVAERISAAMTFRWMWDEPASGAWNMALDEALLESAGDDPMATLRFYRWSEPTLSLGYFQRSAERAAHIASRDCPLVRRASGGGAILHDAELTYSLTIPTTDRWSAAAARLAPGDSCRAPRGARIARRGDNNLRLSDRRRANGPRNTRSYRANGIAVSLFPAPRRRRSDLRRRKDRRQRSTAPLSRDLAAWERVAGGVGLCS